ncbi:4-hydroxybenzoate polyprenyl transferase [Auriscalpium vulgare]|uniref:4-hydroxybenzoate polyprenyl transferase n=2 Tax=Auriscalpium vulgare TaxID=40419 RepID=A0ACB8RB99_9AGAM|nr:4-hydroxybenzoate polyprenyl transferase [Auriscalpium vulgare]KAI0041339.1 4-hydroxybenzoate polyprenyl transferase [Auriscalpium vulgare]
MSATKSTSAIRPWIELSRVHKFAGSMLIFWPLAWGLTMSAHAVSMPLATYAFNLVYGLVFAALLHSAGCIWNDILDRNFDRQVERTKHRPIADGRITVPGAVIFLFSHLLALTALMWPFNHLAWQIGLITVFPLPGIYPFMKRVTYWPQAWLGIAMNMVAIVVCSAVQQQVTPAALALLSGCWSWTLYYDTIYACQDKRDDLKAGVKSTAILFGSHVKTILALFAALLTVSLALAGHLNKQGPAFFALTVGGAGLHLASQLKKLDVDNVRSCFVAFEANGFTFGSIVWAGLFVDYLLV